MEKEKERNINVQLPLMCPLLGAWPATQACALTGNETDDPLFPRSVLNPLSHTSQGSCGFLKKFYSFIFRERGREGEREGEKLHQSVASHALPTGDLAGNPGMCPDWKSNCQPFGLQASTQSAEPHQPGLLWFFKKILFIYF